MPTQFYLGLLVIFHHRLYIGLATLLVVVHLFLDFVGELCLFFLCRALNALGAQGFKNQIIEFLLKIACTFYICFDIIVDCNLHKHTGVLCTSGSGFESPPMTITLRASFQVRGLDLRIPMASY